MQKEIDEKEEVERKELEESQLRKSQQEEWVSHDLTNAQRFDLVNYSIINNSNRYLEDFASEGGEEGRICFVGSAVYTAAKLSNETRNADINTRPHQLL